MSENTLNEQITIEMPTMPELPEGKGKDTFDERAYLQDTPEVAAQVEKVAQTVKFATDHTFTVPTAELPTVLGNLPAIEKAVKEAREEYGKCAKAYGTAAAERLAQWAAELVAEGKNVKYKGNGVSLAMDERTLIVGSFHGYLTAFAIRGLSIKATAGHATSAKNGETVTGAFESENLVGAFKLVATAEDKGKNIATVLKKLVAARKAAIEGDNGRAVGLLGWVTRTYPQLALTDLLLVVQASIYSFQSGQMNAKLGELKTATATVQATKSAAA